MKCQVCMFEAIDSSMLLLLDSWLVVTEKKCLNRICLMQYTHFVCKHNNNLLWSLLLFPVLYQTFSVFIMRRKQRRIQDYHSRPLYGESDFLGTATIHNPHPHPTHMHLHLSIKKWTFFQNVLNYNRYFPTCISSRKAKSIPKYVRNSCRSQKINSQSGWGL